MHLFRTRAFFECSVEKTKCTDSLKSTIQQLEHDLKDATSSRNVLNKRLHELQLHFVDAMNSMLGSSVTIDGLTVVTGDPNRKLLNGDSALVKAQKSCAVVFPMDQHNHWLKVMNRTRLPTFIDVFSH